MNQTPGLQTTQPEAELRATPKTGVIIGIVLATIAAPIIGGVGTAVAVAEWYPTIKKPTWTPPGWLFGPVWTLLYCMMGAAAVLAYRAARKRGLPWASMLAAYGVQLCLNIAWSYVFFWARLPGWALAEILLLLLMIVVAMVMMWKTRPFAGALMIPYALWVTFAAMLNWSIWSLNR